MAPVLSEYIGAGWKVRLGRLINLNKFCKQITSQAASERATYLALQVDVATRFCLSNDQEMGELLVWR